MGRGEKMSPLHSFQNIILSSWHQTLPKLHCKSSSTHVPSFLCAFGMFFFFFFFYLILHFKNFCEDFLMDHKLKWQQCFSGPKVKKRRTRWAFVFCNVLCLYQSKGVRNFTIKRILDELLSETQITVVLNTKIKSARWKINEALKLTEKCPHRSFKEQKYNLRYWITSPPELLSVCKHRGGKEPVIPF